MTIYYIPPYDGFSKVTAFAPVCLSIPSSYPRPHDLISLTATGLPYACWGRGAAPERGPAEAALPPLLHRRLADPLRRRALRRMDTAELPPRTCAGGIRATITFPTCVNTLPLPFPYTPPSKGSIVAYGPSKAGRC